MANGLRQNIAQLRPGNKILTYDGSNLSYSEIILILDKNTQEKSKIIVFLQYHRIMFMSTLFSTLLHFSYRIQSYNQFD